MSFLTRWWFAPAPPERLAAVRILVGVFALVYSVARFPELHNVTSLGRSSFHPVGVVKLLEAPQSPLVVYLLALATLVALVAFILGVRYRIVGPLAAALLLWTTSYRTSWGMIFHTDNLLVLHVLALAIAPAADAWAWRRDRTRPPALAGYGWPLKLLVALAAVTYVLAGIAKLRVGGFAWIDGEVLRNHIAIDNARKALLGDGLAPFATVFFDHPRAFTVLSLMSLALELGAVIALVGGRLAKLWALGAWGFHVGVVLLMNIWFVYPLSGVAVAALFAVERPVGSVLKRLRLIKDPLPRATIVRE